jgi:UDP-galactopyranose mutase
MTLQYGTSMARSLICFSHLRWDFVYQRPQHLMSRAARDGRVIFMEEPVFKEGESPRLLLSRRPGDVLVATPVLNPHGTEAEHIHAQRRMLNGLLIDEEIDDLWCWYYTPMALRISDHLSPRLCVYDCMDELTAFKFAPSELTEWETRLLGRADLVFTGGRSLYRAKAGRHSRCYAFPSSVDVSHFAAARDAETVEPADQASLPYPRVGFFGVIDERMDLDLVAQVAALSPSLHFVFLGPVAKIDPAELPRGDNLHWLGFKPYAELPAYLKGWQSAFMPFALNESTRYISPTKTPEFLAAGLPVCSTAIADVVDPYAAKGLVQIVATPEEAAQCLEELVRGVSRSWRTKVDQHLRDMSWDKTWSAMRELMLSAASSRTGGRSPPVPAAALRRREAR